MFLPLLTAAVVCGQFSNHSLGVGANAATSIDHHPLWSLSLEGSWYIENGFDLYVQVPFTLTTTTPNRLTPATGIHLGVRYLFLEESIRPWVGLHLANVTVFTMPDPTIFAGVGAAAGLEFFFTDAFTIGARGTYDLVLNVDLTRPVDVRHNFGASLSVATWF